MNKPAQQLTDAELAEWDAEIEAKFQRVVAGARAAGRRKRGERLVACPLAFLAEVCRRTEGRTALVLALCIYRRTHVCNSRTVTLPGAELTELGIDRRRKQEALLRLEASGFVRVAQSGPGRGATVTLLWQKC